MKESERILGLAKINSLFKKQKIEIESMMSPIFFNIDDYVLRIEDESNNILKIRVRNRSEEEKSVTYYEFKKAPNKSAVYVFKNMFNLNQLVLDSFEFGKQIKVTEGNK